MIFKNEKEELFEIIDNEPRIHFKEISASAQTLSGVLKKQVRGWRLEVKLFALMKYGQMKAFQVYLKSSRNLFVLVKQADHLKQFLPPQSSQLPVTLSYEGEEDQFLSDLSTEEKIELSHVIEIEMKSTELF